MLPDMRCVRTREPSFEATTQATSHAPITAAVRRVRQRRHAVQSREMPERGEVRRGQKHRMYADTIEGLPPSRAV